MAKTAAELARAYIEALQAKDKKAILSILADDFALEIPLNVPGTNDYSDSWRGLDAANTNYDVTFRTIDVLKYTDIEITQGKDANVAFLEGLGVMKMMNGRPYKNRYVFRFDTADGKIVRIREYTNPITSAIAFGMPLPKQSAIDFNDRFVTAGPSASNRM